MSKLIQSPKGIVAIECAGCKCVAFRRIKYVNYNIKHQHNSFCSSACAAKYNAAKRKAPEKHIPCECCGADFQLKLPWKRQRFCCRTCASRGSITAARKGAFVNVKLSREQRVTNVRSALLTAVDKSLEKLSSALTAHGVECVLEHRIEDFYFDIYIPSKKLLIELDGKYHAKSSTKIRDYMKTKVAKEQDMFLERVLDTKEEGVLKALQICLDKYGIKLNWE